MDGFAFDGGTLAVLAGAAISEIVNRVSDDSMFVTNLAQRVAHLEKSQMRLDAS